MVAAAEAASGPIVPRLRAAIARTRCSSSVRVRVSGSTAALPKDPSASAPPSRTTGEGSSSVALRRSKTTSEPAIDRAARAAWRRTNSSGSLNAGRSVAEAAGPISPRAMQAVARTSHASDWSAAANSGSASSPRSAKARTASRRASVAGAPRSSGEARTVAPGRSRSTVRTDKPPEWVISSIVREFRVPGRAHQRSLSCEVILARSFRPPASTPGFPRYS